jgi:ABC-type transport system involved in multi-copper enzyme maturation permease subunit
VLNLIKLELKKNKFNGNLLSVAVISAVISIVIILMYFNFGEVGMDEELSYSGMLMMIDLVVRATYIVYAAALLAKFVISEYRSKTMQVLFTYPVNRKKIISAKLIIVAVWTFLAIIVTNICVTGVFFITDASFDRIPETLKMSILGEHAWKMVVYAIAAAGMSLIPLAFGMIKKSTITTVVSSIIIVSLVNSNNGGFSLSTYIVVPISLAIIGVVIAYMSFRNIDKVDLL